MNNIYSAVVFDLHPKVRELIDKLNGDGQIDLDGSGYPYVLAVDKTGSNYTVKIARNGQEESIILNTRKRADPVKSWNPLDGFRRQGGRKVIQVDTGGGEPAARPERARRPSLESFRRLTDEILRG